MRTLIVILLLVASCFAVDRNAATCSAANINTQITASSAGDRVLVPSGTCTWSTPGAGTPAINLNKGIQLVGNTVCSGSPVTCVDNTIINDGTGAGAGEDMLDMVAANSRVTGFSFRDPRNLADSKSGVQMSCTNCRFDHNSMTQANTGGDTRGIYIFSVVGGTQLVDHNYFKDLNGGSDIEGSAGGDAVFPGDVSWATALSPGSANAAYIEDNNFDFSSGVVLDGAFDAYAGARFVFRFNIVTNTNGGTHGLDSGGLRSVLLQEIYKNTFTNAGGAIYTFTNTRGGVHYVWGNTISAAGGSYNSFMVIQNYRGDSTYVSSWNPCDGTNIIDQNTTSQQGYACRDQVGRGPETAPASDWPTNASTPTYSEPLMPAYMWANSYKGAAPSITDVSISGGGSSPTRVQTFQILNNRDFYMEVAGFNGTTGTGSGTLASRPATCTTGVAYWATDQGSWNVSGNGQGQGVLYQCSSTNTWTSYYTPYTYPHPLQGTATTAVAPASTMFARIETPR